MRFKLSRWLNTDASAKEESSNPEIRILFSPTIEAQDSQVDDIPDIEVEEAAELVDTTLFRAYMLCRPQLVGPLVRRPNRCIPAVVQEMLEQAHVPPHPFPLIIRRLIMCGCVEISRFGVIFIGKGTSSTSVTIITIFRTERRS